MIILEIQNLTFGILSLVAFTKIGITVPEITSLGVYGSTIDNDLRQQIL
jgi:hypothetical protein